ncbi:MAG: hypothetical protein ACJ79V_15340 [Myxococcales bacterium]
MARYGRWVGLPEVEPPRLVRERDKIDLAIKDGDEWRGLAVFVYAWGPWTVFEHLSGGLTGRSDENWLELAQNDDLVYIDCNDAALYAELLAASKGRLIRHFLQDEQDPGDNVNIGKLPEEGRERFEIRPTHWRSAGRDTNIMASRPTLGCREQLRDKANRGRLEGVHR